MIELKNDNIIPGFDDETNKELRINLFKAQAEDVIIVSPKGYIDTYNTAFFNKKMEAVLKKYHKIIFDLSGINYVSSTGIGAFTGLLRHIKPKGGDMILINVQPKVYEVFSLLGFTSFFNFSHNIESALE
jgi:anti-anti-sigma factor